MNYILLSGGSGKRLWPLSNDVRSKQFIKVFKNENGNYLSMVQNVYNQIREVDSDSKITIATSETQVPIIYNQLGSDVALCVEPCRRDTFPAIALAVAYLRDVLHVKEDETVVVCPVDPYVTPDYFLAMQKLDAITKCGESNLTLMGIEPTYPSEKYGYIMPKDNEAVSVVESFKEKPDCETAQRYIREGAIWNAGVFAFKLEYMINKAKELLNYVSYDELLARYSTLEKISFDYAVVEKETKIQVLRYKGLWKDLGTWNAFAEVAEEDVIGKGILGTNCKNVKIINELQLPILCMGLQNVIIAASDQGILISDKDETDYIKSYVEQLDDTVMFSDKLWGSFRVISKNERNLVAKLEIKEGKEIPYRCNKSIDEIWNVLSGEGIITLEDNEKVVKRGDSIMIPHDTNYKFFANTDMEVIEVQIGENVSSDKMNF